MYTYTIQAAAPSGETFVIEWHGEAIHGLCGPLSGAEREQAIAEIEDASSFEYDTDVAGIDDTPAGWGFPVAAYDPATNEAWRQ